MGGAVPVARRGRVIDLTAPRSGEWAIVADNARVAFCGRAARFLPQVRAQFQRVAGTIRLHHEDASSVDVDVDLTSITTGNPAWDEVLRAVDPFDVARHPVGEYRSSRVRVAGQRAEVDGVLRLRGQESDVRLTGIHCDLDEGRARLTATGTVNREAFGLRFDVPACRFLLPAQMQLQVDVVVTRRA